MHRLRELRKQKKLSARELGLILGYAESTIYNGNAVSENQI